MNNLINDNKFKDIMNKIQSRRMDLKLSYQDLADKTGLSKSTLQRYETGSIRNIPLDKLELLANALEVSPMWIIGYNDETDKNKQINTNLSKEETYLLNTYNKLNELGKAEAVKRVEELTYITRYIEGDTKVVELPSNNKENDNELCATLMVAEENAPYIPAAHSDEIDEETNRANLEKIKALYNDIKN